jgi:flagellar biosynthesis GTPase FlhF
MSETLTSTAPRNLPQSIEGRSVADAKRIAERKLGGPIRVISVQEREAEGGYFGFFEKRRVKILVQRDEATDPDESSFLLESEEGADLEFDISPEAFRLARELQNAVSTPLDEPVLAAPSSRQASTVPVEALHIDTADLIDEHGLARPAPFDNKSFANEVRALLEKGEVEEVQEVPVVTSEPVEALSPPSPVTTPPQVQPEVQEVSVVTPEPVEALSPPSLVTTPSQVQPDVPVPSEAPEVVLSVGANFDIKRTLEAGHLSEDLINEIVEEFNWLGAEFKTKEAASALIIRRLTLPSVSLTKMKNIVIVGERGSGRSTIIAGLAHLLASGGRKIGIVSIGSISNPGTARIREIAFQTGIFHTWAPTSSDPSISALSKEVDLLLIDMDDADPLLHTKSLEALRKAVRGRLTQVASIRSGGSVTDNLERVSHYPGLSALALSAASAASAAEPGEIVNLAAKAKKPLIFLGTPEGVTLFDPSPVVSRLLG